MPSAKFRFSGKSAHFTVTDHQGRWMPEQFHGLDVYLPAYQKYRRYTPRVVAFATMLTTFWQQNAGRMWAWRDSVSTVGRFYMKGVRWPDQERDTYTKAKELIREGTFEDYELDGVVYVYASTRGGKALSGFVDQAKTAEVYDQVNQRMLRLMTDRVETGTVVPAAAALGSKVRVKRPAIKTLN